MKKRVLYLIRHGQPLGDGTPRYLGSRSNPALSKHGRQQAEALGSWAAVLGLNEVYCSPLERSVETAKYLSCAPVVLKDLAEIDMGLWDGMARAQVRKRFPAEYAARGLDMAGYIVPGGESFVQVQHRALAAVKYVLAQSAGDTVILAHAGVNRTILSHYAALPLSRLMEIPQQCAGISAIVFTGQEAEVLFIDQRPWQSA